jgi:LCP family protein required for cell wall assembly
MINFTKHLLKIIFLLISGTLFLLVIALLYFCSKIKQNPINLIQTSYQAIKSNEFKNQNNLNFMILGLDKRDDLLEKTETTDTIIFSSLDLNKSQLNLISLPRDIWNYQLNSKINEIYPLSLKTDNSFDFIQKNYSEFTGQNIQKTVIITTDNLINFVNIIGGVDAYLDKGFKDTQYPNPEHIKDPNNKKIPIYMTIEFPAGSIHLDSSNVTQFVRSRKGAETASQGGTDIGRIERQQLLINAIIKKVKSKEFVENPQNIINLYNFWHQQIITNLTDQDLISIGVLLNTRLGQLAINKIELPIGQTSKDGIIYHPQTFINKAWVFTTSDKNYTKLKDFISSSLNQSSAILNY